MKVLPTIASISAFHFVLNFDCFWHSLGSGLGRFESGAVPSLFDRTCDLAVDVLWFPFLPVAHVLGVEGPGLAEWLLMVANSVLWGGGPLRPVDSFRSAPASVAHRMGLAYETAQPFCAADAGFAVQVAFRTSAVPRR